MDMAQGHVSLTIASCRNSFPNNIKWKIAYIYTLILRQLELQLYILNCFFLPVMGVTRGQCSDEWGYATTPRIFSWTLNRQVSWAWRRVHASNGLASCRTSFPNNINNWKIAYIFTLSLRQLELQLNRWNFFFLFLLRSDGRSNRTKQVESILSCEPSTQQ